MAARVARGCRARRVGSPHRRAGALIPVPVVRRIQRRAPTQELVSHLEGPGVDRPDPRPDGGLVRQVHAVGKHGVHEGLGGSEIVRIRYGSPELRLRSDVRHSAFRLRVAELRHPKGVM